jgi:hypothetical protein
MRETLQFPYNNGLNFECFKSIMDQFDPELPQIEVGSLYRLSWILGNNSVTIDSFMRAAHERHFFVRNLKIEVFDK